MESQTKFLIHEMLTLDKQHAQLLTGASVGVRSKETRDHMVHRKNKSLLQQKYQTMKPQEDVSVLIKFSGKLDKINEGYQKQNKKMEVMSNNILKLQKRDKS